MAQSTPSHDLRQAGTAAKRTYNHKAKWAHGGRTARSSNDPLAGAAPITRPAKPLFTHSAIRHERTRSTNHLSSAAKFDLRKDVREALDLGPSDSSGVEDCDDISATVRIVDDFQGEDCAVHLYEASGQMIFKDVVNKAVEKFETKETEKLVKEYEIITHESEMAMGYLADEDDFELVDHIHL
ncbi:hypothetical protein P175DRAFT_0533334 [Aspergillus ochraceoroseus IBT 24754]|uniref:Uncharacterized protein n=3 Tax=Aspergillus subgen. Nidulantes TaxID=2720870 RepID=A0A0F8V5J4_9EURO|nr:uncharacterized protein P175DRAFT_0533334 [Aspergillus ochraceoroseus IBT 24754]KKK14719.1 hypothetical protein AOCH_004263 [Aspergillus ochraceoroseus]KKK18231.1 hypothetical protein ARAM_002969 [Aspergillus rambellii]PTU20336.1 hypothetical protein P175DRAFT_0533334 [Aspergillus ochraceoroseus IBT 24754]